MCALTHSIFQKKAPVEPRASQRERASATCSFWGSLESSAFFSRLDAEARRDLAGRLTSSVRSKGTQVVEQGDPGAGLFIIRQGKVKLMRCPEPDRLFVLAILGPGELIGLVGAMDGSRQAFTATALTDVHLLSLQKEDLRQHVRRFPETGLLLLREMSSRLRLLAETLENLALTNVSVRLVRTLVHLSRKSSIMDGSGLLVLQPPSQQDLALMVGACRETVSRVLTNLIRERQAERRGRTILLKYELLRSCGLSDSFSDLPKDTQAVAVAAAAAGGG